jgi:hypothetical protein
MWWTSHKHPVKPLVGPVPEAPNPVAPIVSYPIAYGALTDVSSASGIANFTHGGVATLSLVIINPDGSSPNGSINIMANFPYGATAIDIRNRMIAAFKAQYPGVQIVILNI